MELPEERNKLGTGTTVKVTNVVPFTDQSAKVPSVPYHFRVKHRATSIHLNSFATFPTELSYLRLRPLLSPMSMAESSIRRVKKRKMPMEEE